MGRKICFLSEAFPPDIDGVSNAVLNYANWTDAAHGESVVVTPEWPGSDDSKYTYPVLRYPSIDTRKSIGYVTGKPIVDSNVLEELKKNPPDVMHVHCPTVSLVLARELRDVLNVPIVFTYHTKYDIEIRRGVRGKWLQENLIKVMVDNISACDEVWVVSEGAGENLKSLGYTGEYRVMENGVDMERGRVSGQVIQDAVKDYDLPEGLPVFLFVGRMLWYKGQRLILEALQGLASRGVDFRMVFIGGGDDLEDMRKLAEELGIADKVIFTGAIRDRQKIRGWYCRANAFLFPSTFDTNGLVVREAAACSLPAVLVKGSCAAEGVTDNVNGYLVSENAPSLAVALYQIASDLDAARVVGENAARDLYISWETAVSRANARYENVIENYKNGMYERKFKRTDAMLKGVAETVELVGRLKENMREIAPN